uniref:Uncharacterized protein n=1 Tax=Arion vulgaris TaxID=1028688 RepID=A0A0B7C2V1_9EUPU
MIQLYYYNFLLCDTDLYVSIGYIQHDNSCWIMLATTVGPIKYEVKTFLLNSRHSYSHPLLSSSFISSSNYKNQL